MDASFCQWIPHFANGISATQQVAEIPFIPFIHLEKLKSEAFPGKILKNHKRTSCKPPLKPTGEDMEEEGVAASL